MAAAITARTPPQLGAALRRRRKGLNLSQAEVGDRVGIRQATLSMLESGGADSKVSTLMDVLAALDLELVLRPRRGGDEASIEDLF
jgi:HTH-type transcriptional regulator/antitoxin HipB